MPIKMQKYLYEIIYYTDQYLRQKIGMVKNSFIKRLLWYCIKIFDFFNQKIVFWIIDRYGWPLVRDYGKKANITAYYVIMHSNETGLKKYYPILKQAAKNEHENCHYFCHVLDRLLMYQKKKQFFGCDARGLKDNNGMLHYYVYPISHFSNVNNRRIKVGMNSIEEHAAENNYILHYSEGICKALIKYPNK